MSQENVELVREIIAAVPDWHAVSALLHPDARFDQTRIPDGGVYEGREACGRFFERWFGTWDEIRMTPERFIEDGDRVLALMTIEGRGKGSGVPVVIRSADLFTVRDGKIVSLVGYPDRAEALEAVGLSEEAMSQEHVDVVRRAWSAFAEGGLEAELVFHARDAVYEDLPEMADRATYRGPEGFIKRNRQWRESWEEFHTRPLEFIDAGGGVVIVPVATTVLGKGSRVPIESGHTWVYDVRDGKIVRERAFRSTAEALEAIGLQE